MSINEILEELPKLSGQELEELSYRVQFLRALRDGLTEITHGPLIPHEQVKKELPSGFQNNLGRSGGGASFLRILCLFAAIQLSTNHESPITFHLAPAPSAVEFLPLRLCGFA
jgi:hypothetical protein